MHTARLLAALLALVSPAVAGEPASSAFPMDGAGDVLVLDPGQALELGRRETVRLTDVPLPGGAVDVVLRRARVDLGELAFQVDGSPARFPHDPTASTWHGRIAGVPDSDVVLGFSRHGTRGWVRAGADLWHLLAAPGNGGDWSASTSRFVTEAELARGAARPFPACDARPVPGAGPRPAPVGGAEALLGPPGDTRLLRLAVETDHQLYQRFLSIPALTAYLNQLLAATSARYDADVGTRIQLVYLGLHANSNDGWSAPDTGAGAGAMLDEFRTTWGSLPAGAHLAHFLSGADLGGGVAYLDVLCNPAWGFGVSGNLAGNTPFPVTQGPLSWDFYVFNHEVGHNFASPHTHEYCPPLDECAAPSAFGPCQTSQVCSTNGTIMSYCHTCGNGMSNIALVFHPANAATMRAAVAASCLPVLCTAPSTYCSTSPNSYDPFGAYIQMNGSNDIAANDLQLLATGVPPGTSGIFFYGRNATSVPFGNGTRCIGSPTFRLPVVVANEFGESDFAFDQTAVPPGGGIAAGETWHFQLWYRNAAGGGAGFNLSDGLRIQFCP